MIAEYKALMASRLTPTVDRVSPEEMRSTVGVSLLAMAVKQPPQISARDYLSRIASVRALSTGLSK